MKSKDFRRMWKRSAHTIILRKYKNVLKKDKLESSIRRHAERRLAYNLYHAGFFIEASDMLEKMCITEAESIPNDDLQLSSLTEKQRVQLPSDELSDIHHTAGLCCIALFHETHLHSHLENAYAHYQKSIDNMPMNLYTIFRLPHLLLEFGHILEHYGSFQSALEVYTQILTYFHNTRGYFDAMYRSAIVTKHLASDSDDDDRREEIVLKCIDIFHFLLEAVPPTINELHVVFLYAQTLRESQLNSNYLRAAAVMRSVHDLCKQHQPPLARSDVYKSFDDWESEPEVWLQFARELHDSKEPLISREAYDRLLECIALKSSQGKESTVALTPALYLELARNRAKVQYYEGAVFFAELAIAEDRYHAEARKLLAKWSRSHKEQFEVEESAVRTLECVWRQRCWFPGFRKILKQNIVKANEEAIDHDPFNLQLRSALSYYARGRWRAKFLFENHCAKRIQVAYRMARSRWTWQTPIRAVYLERTNQILEQYKMQPYDPLIREKIRKIFMNPFSPKKHEITVSLKKLFLKQDLAHARIVKALRFSIFKSNLRRALEIHKLNRLGVASTYAVKIQCALRCALARRAVGRARVARNERIIAAIKVQSAYRAYVSVKFVRDLKIGRIKEQTREAAGKLLARVVPAMISIYHAKRKLRQLREEKELKKCSCLDHSLHASIRAKQWWTLAIQFAIQFSRARSVNIRNKFYNVVMLALHVSRSKQFSCTSRDLGLTLKADHPNHYHPPGISQTSPQFSQVLEQTSVFCDSSFTSVDALMLGKVLRHKQCRVKELILYQVDAIHPSYTNDFVSAIGACRSLVTVRILGGQWSEACLTKLIGAIQVDNPCVKTLDIESVEDASEMSYAIARSCGLLVADFFNYSVPGICKLSLHELGIKDADLDLLVKGLSCNRSLRQLHLSQNFITDEGLHRLILAMLENSHLCMEMLCMRQNLVQGTVALLGDIRSLFSKIAFKSTATFILDLVKNPMISERDCDIMYRFGLKTVVAINNQVVSSTLEQQSPGKERSSHGRKGTLRASTNLKAKTRSMSRDKSLNSIRLAPMSRTSITPGRVKSLHPASSW